MHFINMRCWREKYILTLGKYHNQMDPLSNAEF